MHVYILPQSAKPSIKTIFLNHKCKKGDLKFLPDEKSSFLEMQNSK